MKGEGEREALAREFDRHRAEDDDILEAITTDSEKHQRRLAMVEQLIP